MINDLPDLYNIAIAVHTWLVLRIYKHNFVPTMQPWLGHAAGDIAKKDGYLLHRYAFLHLGHIRMPSGIRGCSIHESRIELRVLPQMATPVSACTM